MDWMEYRRMFDDLTTSYPTNLFTRMSEKRNAMKFTTNGPENRTYECSCAASIVEMYEQGKMSEKEAKEELEKLGFRQIHIDEQSKRLFDKIVEARRILDYLMEEDPRTFKDPHCKNEQAYDAINVARKELEMAEIYVIKEAEKHD